MGDLKCFGPGAARIVPVVPAVLLAGLLALVVSGCRAGPEPVQYGVEECAYCRMVIDEPGFGAQAVSVRGKAYKFDSVECLAGFVLSGVLAEEEIGSLWVADFTDPGHWVPARQAVYLRSQGVRSPMGLGLAAHGSRDGAEEHRSAVEGELLTWEEVQEVVNREWAGGGSGHEHP